MAKFFNPNRPSCGFLCFISDSQSVDISGQGWGGGKGVIIERKEKKQIYFMFLETFPFITLFVFLKNSITSCHRFSTIVPDNVGELCPPVDGDDDGEVADEHHEDWQDPGQSDEVAEV